MVDLAFVNVLPDHQMRIHRSVIESRQFVQLILFHPVHYGYSRLKGSCLSPNAIGHNYANQKIHFNILYIRDTDDDLLYCRFDRTIVIALQDPLRLKCRSAYKELHLSMWVYVYTDPIRRPIEMLLNDNSIFATRRTTKDAEYILHSLPMGNPNRGYRLLISVKFIGLPISRVYEIVSLPPFDYSSYIVAGSQFRKVYPNKRANNQHDLVRFFQPSLNYYAKTLQDYHRAKLRLQYDPKYTLYHELSSDKIIISLLMRANSVITVIRYLATTMTEPEQILQLKTIQNDISALMLRLNLHENFLTTKILDAMAQICSDLLNTPKLVSSNTRYVVNAYLTLIVNSPSRLRTSSQLLKLCDDVRIYYIRITHMSLPEAIEEIDHALYATSLVNHLLLSLISKTPLDKIMNNPAIYTADMIAANSYNVIVLRNAEFVSPHQYSIFMSGVDDQTLMQNPIVFLFLQNELVLLDELKYGTSKLRQVFAFLKADTQTYRKRDNKRQRQQQRNNKNQTNSSKQTYRRKIRQAAKPADTDNKRNINLGKATIKYITPLVQRPDDEKSIRICKLKSHFNISSRTSKYGSNLLLTAALQPASIEMVSVYLDVVLITGITCQQSSAIFENSSNISERRTVPINPSKDHLGPTILFTTLPNTAICLLVYVKSQIDQFRSSSPDLSDRIENECILQIDLYETSCNAFTTSNDLTGSFYKPSRSILPEEQEANRKQCRQVDVHFNETITTQYGLKMACLCVLGLNYMSYSRPLNYTVVWGTSYHEKIPSEIPVAGFDDYAPYRYKVTTFTGLQQKAISKARVFLRLVGQRRSDFPKCLNENYAESTFKRGSVNTFLLSTHINLGDIKAVNFWHDESGPDPSWYIRHCIVHDITHKKTFYFCCYSWLSNARASRQINRIFPRSQKIDYYSFGHLFISTFCWNLYHYHTIWSIFLYQARCHCKCLTRCNIIFTTLLLLYLPIYQYHAYYDSHLPSSPSTLMTSSSAVQHVSEGRETNSIRQHLGEYLTIAMYSALAVSLIPIALTYLFELAFERLNNLKVSAYYQSDKEKVRGANAIISSQRIHVFHKKRNSDYNPLFTNHQQMENRKQQIRMIISGLMKDNSRYKRQIDICDYVFQYRSHHNRRPEWLDEKFTKCAESSFFSDAMLDSIQHECELESQIIKQEGIDSLLTLKYTSPPNKLSTAAEEHDVTDSAVSPAVETELDKINLNLLTPYGHAKNKQTKDYNENRGDSLTARTAMYGNDQPQINSSDSRKYASKLSFDSIHNLSVSNVAPLVGKMYAYALIGFTCLLILVVLALIVRMIARPVTISTTHFLFGIYAHCCSFVILQVVQVLLIVISAIINSLLIKKSDWKKFSTSSLLSSTANSKTNEAMQEYRTVKETPSAVSFSNNAHCRKDSASVATINTISSSAVGAGNDQDKLHCEQTYNRRITDNSRNIVNSCLDVSLSGANKNLFLNKDIIRENEQCNISHASITSSILPLYTISTNAASDQHIRYQLSENGDRNILQHLANSNQIEFGKATDTHLQSKIKERILENNLVEAVRDIIGYMLFLILVCILSYEGMNNIEDFYNTRTIIRKFFYADGIFNKMQKPEQFLFWASSILDNRMFPGRRQYHCAFKVCHISQVPREPFFIVKDIRLKQARTRLFSCSHIPYKDYNIGYEPDICMTFVNQLTDHYFYNENFTSKGWSGNYSSSQCTKSPWLSYKRKTGKKLYKYFNGPYEYVLILSSKDSISLCDRRKNYDDLIARQWIDQKSQVVLMEGSFYNPNTDIVSAFTLSTELLPTGDMKKQCEISHVYLNSKQDKVGLAGDHTGSSCCSLKQVVRICHYIYAVSIFVYFINELLQIYRLTRDYGFRGFSAYLNSFANWLDISLILISFAYFSFYLFQLRLAKSNMKILSSQNQAFVDYRALAFNQQLLIILQGLMIFVSIIKLLNLLKFNPKTFLLTETISVSRSGFLVLSFAYVVNLFIFTLIGRSFFRRDKKFATINQAFVTAYSSVTKGSESLDLFRNNKFLSTLWLFSLWIISQIFIQNFLISFVINKFAHIRKHHVVSDEEKVLGRVVNKIASYFGAVGEQQTVHGDKLT
ncbi:hypothetical protein GJ496_011569 [Pomphorhynchus laevis]|nr:hypothetical protein GJ496_011569 [Pomphorhynchus laevis]